MLTDDSCLVCQQTISAWPSLEDSPANDGGAIVAPSRSPSGEGAAPRPSSVGQVLSHTTTLAQHGASGAEAIGEYQRVPSLSVRS